LQGFRKLSPTRTMLATVGAVLIALTSGCASLPGALPGQEQSSSIVPSTYDAPPRPIEHSADVATAAPPAEREAEAAPDTSLWDRIRAGFKMPELDTPLVAEKERFYLARRDYLDRMYQRGSRYLFHIVEEIEKRGLPTELALLPFVESAMNPTALSSAQAAGLWQFIPSTGKAYDLHQNWWVDNRRDVVKSTSAALDYLQKIYEMQGNDWFLALASYNWGEGAVARAVKKNKAKGRPADYLSLNMPAETRHYVPKLIALKNILLRADELGITLPDLPNRPYFITIEKTRPIDLKLAAQFAGMSVEEFVALNPAHNRPVIAASKNNEIKLPADRVDDFLIAVEKHAEASKVFASWQPYTLKPGESIESIAGAFGVSAAEIRKANGIQSRQNILAGTRLLAPHKNVVDESRVENFVAPRVYERVVRPAQYHTVKRKETLASIARRYGVSTGTLTAWNGLKQGIHNGMRLLVRPTTTQTLLTNEHGDTQVVSTTKDAEIVKTGNPNAKNRKAGKAPQRRTRSRVSTARSPRASRPKVQAAGARATVPGTSKAAPKSQKADSPRRKRT
jgi:membrane-bound lytic murein transglycosylase D